MDEGLRNGIILFSVIILIVWYIYWNGERDIKRYNTTKDAISPINTSKSIVKKEEIISDNDLDKLQVISSEYDFTEWKSEMRKKLDNFYSLSDLLIVKECNEIIYGDLLSCFEWEFKRLAILLRDKYACNDCMVEGSSNHVHHLFYLQDKLPWDIDDSALITLCYNCHKKRHEIEEISVFKVSGSSKTLVSREKMLCNRCGGTGYLPQFRHVQKGICFKCWGLRKSVFIKVLEKSYNNINKYNDPKRRKEYVRFLNDLTNQELYSSLPKGIRYEFKNTNDDLPF